MHYRLIERVAAAQPQVFVIHFRWGLGHAMRLRRLWLPCWNICTTDQDQPALNWFGGNLNQFVLKFMQVFDICRLGDKEGGTVTSGWMALCITINVGNVGDVPCIGRAPTR